ncbi:MAG: hypothetical protein COV26_01820 [Candidatus Nealsonbacteria bacterium CG10_big_fil_rev_8_21_14_0_10_36_23]|uniref:Uncharacterized protein n=1 Tax=Candidatus Nealsonbacteria bacterium CG10_big_fil_rev_8_21_14_0_10_36_23 TaxID=1974709 RepID=A0A2H0TL09_9BACT|nr:MAG: hypothetical protein COV26_01820 [Candidatus Nealsonbacteria bacterium CG10_big_fil_rev_8_21_14_0_10_36_23]
MLKLVKISEFIKKLQTLPELKRKIIFWSIIIILGTSLFILYIKNIGQKIKSFQKEEFLEELKIPQLKEEMKIVPQPEVEENFKKLKELIKEMEEAKHSQYEEK